MKSAVILLAFASVALAIHSVDLYAPLSATTVSCLKSAGYTGVISRCYHSSGTVDTGVRTTYPNVAAAGLAFDVYHFPDVAQPADAQITAAINYMHTNNIKFARYYLDIEPLHWPTNKTSNLNFVRGLVNRLLAMGVTDIGFYTSKNAWDQIMGTVTEFSKYPLWYPHYQTPAQENFNDFVSFGGWTKPYMKQFAGDKTVCSTDVDQNWRP